MPAIVLTYGEYEEPLEPNVGSQAWKHQRVVNVLASYAKALFNGHDEELRPIRNLANASRSTFEVALTDSSLEALFFFGHGTSGPDGGLQGQDSTPLLDATNLHLLKGAILYAAACWSADRFGAMAADLGVAVLGYRKELWVPLREPLVSRMRHAVLSGALVLLEGEPLSIAFANTTQTYKALALSLFAEGSAAMRTAATFVDLNSDSVALLGDGQRALTRSTP